jgi:hypothetical protein
LLPFRYKSYNIVVNRRTLPRVTLLAPVFFRAQNPRESWGRFRDISLCGARLVTRCPLVEGEAINFDMTLAPGCAVSGVSAEVVWIKRDGAYVVCGLAISDGGASEKILKGIKILLARQKERWLKENGEPARQASGAA